MLRRDANTIRVLCGISRRHETSSEMSLPGGCRERRPSALQQREGACLPLRARTLPRGGGNAVRPLRFGDSTSGKSCCFCCGVQGEPREQGLFGKGPSLFLVFSRSCKAAEAKRMLGTAAPALRHQGYILPR